MARHSVFGRCRSRSVARHDTARVRRAAGTAGTAGRICSPATVAVALGGSPVSRARSARLPPPALGITSTSAWVYGCTGCADDVGGPALLNHLAQVQHGDAVGEHPGQGQVVGDEQDCHTEPFTHVQQHPDAHRPAATRRASRPVRRPPAAAARRPARPRSRPAGAGRRTTRRCAARRWRPPVSARTSREPPAPHRAGRSRPGRCGEWRSPSMTTSSAVALAGRLSNGSWKIIWKSRRSLRSVRPRARVMSDPADRHRPRASPRRSRMMVRATVVLPQPDSPTRATISRSCTDKSTPSTARAISRAAAVPHREVHAQVADLGDHRRGHEGTATR